MAQSAKQLDRRCQRTLQALEYRLAVPPKKRRLQNATRAAQPAVIDAGYVKLILSGVGESGHRTEDILRKSGLDLSVFSAGCLSQVEFARLIKVITRVTRDELWCLCDRPVRLGTFQTMCRQIVRCKTLGEAIKAGARFYRLIVDDFTIRVGVSNGEAAIWITDCVTHQQKRRMINGAVSFFLYGLMCWLVGRRIPLKAVHYAFPEEPYSSTLTRFYGAPLLYSQSSSRILLDAKILDLAIIQDEIRLERFLASVPTSLLVRFTDRSSLSERAASILRRDLTSPLSLEAVAKLLQVSPQTLRRRIQDDLNGGFQSLKDLVRKNAAIELLLHNRRRPLEEIAIALGFSELSTFHRAFKRWTGVPPGEYRELFASQNGPFDGDGISI
ncbi:AraC family transcriptional regulator ligand-binding domain-containing protein [Bradyrhizobium tropiciagri]|uniref:AraC family transcriptional regulator n=1 Tax=Bradyrhizobium tropiciagri TaxID=312253 RepID=UPI001BA66EC9|nr:AraC family transcriptional regulator ligand-binding domain-containing protein [Bradyrhizobium tropiciagri]